MKLIQVLLAPVIVATVFFKVRLAVPAAVY